MSVFKRKGSTNYYMKFHFEGREINKCCNTPLESVAKKAERDERIKVAKESELMRLAKFQPKEIAPAPRLADYIRVPVEENDHGGPFWDMHVRRQKPATITAYRERIKAILLSPRLRDLRLDEITGDVLKGYFGDQLDAGLVPRSNLTTLKTILRLAVHSGVILAMPPFMKLPESELCGVALTREHEALYMSRIDVDHQDFVQIMINTAMEPGACSELAWSDVHFDAPGRYTNGYIYDRCTKNKLRKRELAMTSGLAPRLKERWMRMGRPATGLVFPADRLGKKSATPYDSIQSVHQRLWEDRKTRGPIAIPHFRLYDFRHTALTRAVEAGVDAFGLKQMAGWASIRMADRYIHLGPQSRRKAADTLSAYNEMQEKVQQATAASAS